MRERIIYSIDEFGALKGVKTMVNDDLTRKRDTLKERKTKNEKHKTLVNLIKERKKESEAAPINYYKKQYFYKSKNLKDRRKYNQTFRAVYKQHEIVDPEKHRFLMYRESLPKGTSLNVIKNVEFNESPLYVPQVTEEEDKAQREGLKAWQKLRAEWSKSDTKKSRKKPRPKSSLRKNRK